ncbi:hypothetical protein R1flu_023501 [Riccia fluitans]|uniref:Uncharacterized protein n=1 Tax=Riccia fluitans TaxID=41844 RepID=A0ABD1XS71_9MARC
MAVDVCPWIRDGRRGSQRSPTTDVARALSFLREEAAHVSVAEPLQTTALGLALPLTARRSLLENGCSAHSQHQATSDVIARRDLLLRGPALKIAGVHGTCNRLSALSLLFQWTNFRRSASRVSCEEGRKFGNRGSPVRASRSIAKIQMDFTSTWHTINLTRRLFRVTLMHPTQDSESDRTAMPLTNTR